MSRSIEYAYECHSTLMPNCVIHDGTSIHYQICLAIDYELKDADKNLLGKRTVEHYSETSDTLLTAEQVSQWLYANRTSFILADKNTLAGYQE